jgi:uncharacterized iron-regulated protein
MKNTIVLLLLITAGSVFSQKQAYIIYNAQGKEVSYKKMLKELTKKDVVLFGELHNNPISHWLQYEVTSDLYDQRKLILGAEMLEADNQAVLNQYLSGAITQKGLDTLARLWPNYKTDYAPLIDFAKDNQLPFIASNIPRKYASLVYKKDFAALDSLSDATKKFIAPLPIPFDSELPRYKNIMAMMGKHGSPKLVKAQAIKDATMAHFILKNFKDDQLFVHYNGAYHSDFHEGILWYLKKEQPLLKYTTITTVSQENIDKLLEENIDAADYIICVDSHMTNTY